MLYFDICACSKSERTGTNPASADAVSGSESDGSARKKRCAVTLQRYGMSAGADTAAVFFDSGAVSTKWGSSMSSYVDVPDKWNAWTSLVAVERSDGGAEKRRNRLLFLLLRDECSDALTRRLDVPTMRYTERQRFREFGKRKGNL